MNTLVIILGVILVVIVLISLLSKFFSGESTLTANTNLAMGVPDVSAASITSANSAQRTYSIWIYVNTWDATKTKMIFGRQGDVLLYLDDTTATLRCLIAPGGSDITNIQSTTTGNPIDITNNFPIQKWVFVTIALDSSGYCDLYLDGKLVKSVQNPSIANMPDKTSPLQFGKGLDIYIANATRVPSVLGPQDVWNKYVSSNPGSSLKNSIGNYNVNMNLLKDNVVTSSFSAF